MAMIRAIDYAEGDSYQVPEELGVKWYCYAAWNVVGGLESEPTYSRLIRVHTVLLILLFDYTFPFSLF